MKYGNDPTLLPDLASRVRKAPVEESLSEIEQESLSNVEPQPYSGAPDAIPARRVSARKRERRTSTPSGTHVAQVMGAPVTAPVKPYLYVEELAELTPWSVEAINTKVKRGELRQGVHYFQEQGRARRIFKWAAIVEAIEKRGVTPATAASDARSEAAPAPRRRAIDLEKAKAELQRLLD